MNILVLGSEGLIGKPLCTYLKSRGHKVYGIDRVLFEDEHDLSELEGYTTLKHYLLREGVDKIDKVIFLAFNVGGSKYLENNDSTFYYINDNVKLMTHVFRLLHWSKVPFLFASSQMSNMYHTNYGLLKQLGERYTRSIENGWICRFWNVYGPEEYGEKSHVITDFIHQAIENKQITVRTTGVEQRQFLHVNDACKAIETWVDDKWNNRKEYYDITSFEWISISNIALIIKELMNVPYFISTNYDRVQGGIKNEPSEYIRKFWSPEISIEEGIENLIKK
jgi:nucleoside-diphosphate-sugar epimerase